MTFSNARCCPLHSTSLHDDYVSSDFSSDKLSQFCMNEDEDDRNYNQRQQQVNRHNVFEEQIAESEEIMLCSTSLEHDVVGHVQSDNLSMAGTNFDSCRMNVYDFRSAVLDLNVDIEMEASKLVKLDHRTQIMDNHGGANSDADEELLPFLLRFPVNAFGIAMGISSQSMVWKQLTRDVSAQYLAEVGAVFWCAGIITLLSSIIIYALKVCCWPKEVIREFNHPLRSNFFAGPFLAALFLLLGTPIFVRKSEVSIGEAFGFAVPLIFLELHLYGCWIVGGRHRLSETANPTTQISVVGNFVGASALGLAGSKDFAFFLFSMGIVHQLIVFTTIYARFSSTDTINPDFDPVLFLFVAPPNAASLAWNDIVGTVDNFSKFLMFSGLCMYLVLVSRVYTMAKGLRYSLSWWAVTFPSAAAAMATMAYAKNSKDNAAAEHDSSVGVKLSGFSRDLAFLLVAVSNASTAVVLIATMINAYTGNLFRNDLALLPELGNDCPRLPAVDERPSPDELPSILRDQ